MKIKNLIKNIANLSVAILVFISNIIITSACHSAAMDDVYNLINTTISENKCSPLEFVFIFYGNYYNDKQTIENHIIEIINNLNKLKDTLDNNEFNKFLITSFTDDHQAIGKKLNDLLGISKSPTDEITYQSNMNTCNNILDNVFSSNNDYKNKCDQLNLSLKNDKGKDILNKLISAQKDVFTYLKTIDKKLDECKDDAKRFHELEMNVHESTSNNQSICKSRLTLLGENLSKLLADIEENLNHAKSIEPNNLELALDFFECYLKIKHSIINISYITKFEYIMKSLERKLNLRSISPKSELLLKTLNQQEEVGKLQLIISFFKDKIIQIVNDPILESIDEGTTLNAHKPKIILSNPHLVVGIFEKLSTYSLNQYHFLQNNSSAGMDKAYDIWKRLGYTNKDVGILEARIRESLIKEVLNNPTYIKVNNILVIISINGINSEKYKIKTVWTYQKVFEDTKKLLSYPRCVTIYME
ncbi:MAG: hypothetical protein IJI84_04205 [Clostridia bacterium]|nr:hypothetical protein [Clostridia bacterium]